MNMGFRKPHGTELQPVGGEIQSYRSEIDSDAPTMPRTSYKYLALPFALLTGAYVLSAMSITALVITGSVLIALIGLATCVCISAQNNTF